MGNKMQQVTVATAGFEHTQAGTAEFHLANEKVHLAAFHLIEPLSSVPGKEGTGDEGKGNNRESLSSSASPEGGLQDCLAHSRRLAAPWRSRVPQAYAQGSLSLPALSGGEGRRCLEQDSDRAPESWVQQPGSRVV